MLYGGDIINERIITWMNSLNTDSSPSWSVEPPVVYAANVNSIAQGINRASSDYDLEVIRYAHNRSPIVNGPVVNDKIHIDDTNVIDSKLQAIIWNDTTFFSDVVNPYGSDRMIKSAYYYKVFASITSPYRYDPYNLVDSICELLLPVCDLNLVIDYLWRRALTRTDINKPVNLKNYLSRLHCYLSIIWIAENNGFPPNEIGKLFHGIGLKWETSDEFYFYQAHKADSFGFIPDKLIDKLGPHERRACTVYEKQYGKINVVSVEKQEKAYLNVLDIISAQFR